MSKHTKGEWRVVDGDEICCGRKLIGGTFQPDAYRLPDGKKMTLPSIEECKANAHMMAAARKMYLALKAIVDDSSEHRMTGSEATWKMLADAIAAAEGRQA